MRYYSTAGKSPSADLKDAVLRGLAPDGGLYMPESIPLLDKSFFERLRVLTLSEVALAVSEAFFGEDIPKQNLENIVSKSMTFDAPLIKLSDRLHTLELFHGPTLSFKDFGISFMARLVAYMIRNDEQELNILAATSGDTGSAVGHGFLKVPGVRVWILYPQGKVSRIQEQQLTTMGHNVNALEVEGSFDDCQALVKRAFNDVELRRKVRLSSANSINIARLIPQIFYYFFGYGQLDAHLGEQAVFSVPSGNFGNLTAGLLAKRMGLPVQRMVAATNINDSVPVYLESGIFTPHPSKHTLSNAMDVGNPSNFARMLDLYRGDVEAMRHDLVGERFTDAQTEEAIRELYHDYSYIADPHGAVGFLGLNAYQKTAPGHKGIFLETAHPAKFVDIVEGVLHRSIDIPDTLQAALDKEKQTIPLRNDYESLKNLLMPPG